MRPTVGVTFELGTWVSGKTRGRQRLLACLLLLSFLPTLTFLGHWDDIFADAQSAPAPAAALYDLASQQAERTEHAEHCHTDLASCSAQPMPAGIGFLITHDTLLLPPPFRFAAGPPIDVEASIGPATRPLIPPPRSV